MPVIKVKNKEGNWIEVPNTLVVSNKGIVNVVNTTGTSTTDVMSLNAVTEELDKLKPDTELSETSTNAVQNKIVTAKLFELGGLSIKLEQNINTQNQEIDNFKQTITNQINEYKPTVIQGNVTNAADEEDLTAGDKLLKLKNRNNLNGMGYVILRMTDNLKIKMESTPNTIFEIRYNFNLNGIKITLADGCKLKFNGGSLSNGELVLQQTSITNNNPAVFKRNLKVCGSCSNQIVYADWFEQYADGINDDITLFKNLSAIVNSTKSINVLFPSGAKYLVSIVPDYTGSAPITDKSVVLNIHDCDNVVIDFNYSTIRLKESDSTKYNIVRLDLVKNFNISNCIIIGDRLKHDYSKYTANEFGYGISVIGSDGIIKNCITTQCTGDGIFIDAHVISWFTEEEILPNVKVLDCLSAYCRRQGITIGECGDVTIDGCHIHHIGTFDGIEGKDPQSGIDIEFEGTKQIGGNIRINNCHIHDCTHYTIIGNSRKKFTDGEFRNNKCESLHIIGCKLVGNTYTASFLECEDKQIYNCILDYTGEYSLSNPNAVLGIKRCYNSSFKFGKIKFIPKGYYYNCNFESIGEDGNYVGFPIGGIVDLVYDTCSFINIKGDKRSLPVPIKDYNATGFDFYDATEIKKLQFLNCNFKDCSFYMLGYKNPHGNIVFKNCLIDRMLYIVSNDKVTSDFYNCKIENIAPYVIAGGEKIFYNCEIYDKGDMPIRLLDSEKIQAYNCYIEYDEGTATIYAPARDSVLNNCNLNILSLNKTKFDNFIIYNCYVNGLDEKLYKGEKHNTSFSIPLLREGTTSDRPTKCLKMSDIGFIYKDTTIDKLILWSGIDWVNMDGTPLT